MLSFFKTPIWGIVSGPRYCNFKYLLLIFIPNLIAAALEGASFAFIFLAFSSLETLGSNPSSFFSLDPSLFGLSLTKMQTFYYYVLLAVGSQAFRGSVSFLGLFGTSLFSLKVQTQAQKQIYQQIFRFSFPFVSQYKIGDLSEFAKTPASFIPTLFESINRFFVSLFMGFGLLAVLCWISPSLTALTLMLFLLFACGQKFLIKKVLHYSKQLTSHLFEFSHQTVQSLQGIRPIHIFHRQSFILDRINKVLQEIAQSSKRLHLWNNIVPTINETVNVLLVGGILILGSYLLTRPDQPVLSNLLTYVALTYRLATRMQIAMSAVSAIGLHYGPILRLNDLLDDSGKEFDHSAEIEFSGWNRSIEFRDVTLQYSKNQKPALQNVSFSIPKGSSLAIVGSSGAGKSSILDLILCLHKPTSGTIFIDSEPLLSFSHKSWRQCIGVVSQDTFIFNGTIEENIRFGTLDASMTEIKNAAALAGAAEFIGHLPGEYQAVVGERGYKLSGGERQRLALARALLKNPEILILDEATSNLDSHSEQLIQQSLDTLHKTKTLIIVAHRLSTIIKSDQILVLEKGKVIEQGKHEELLQQQGRYAKLWELQSGEFVQLASTISS